MICLTGDKIYDPQQMIKIKEKNQNNEMKQSEEYYSARSAEWNLSTILSIFKKKIMKDKKYESFVLMVVWVKHFYDDVHVIEKKSKKWTFQGEIVYRTHSFLAIKKFLRFCKFSEIKTSFDPYTCI